MPCLPGMKIVVCTYTCCACYSSFSHNSKRRFQLETGGNELHPKSWTRKPTKGVQKSMGKELFSEESAEEAGTAGAATGKQAAVRRKLLFENGE